MFLPCSCRTGMTPKALCTETANELAPDAAYAPAESDADKHMPTAEKVANAADDAAAQTEAHDKDAAKQAQQDEAQATA